MQKLKIVNNYNKSVEFGLNKPYLLSHIEGLGIPSSDIYITQHPGQDGSTVHDLLLADRTIKIKLTLSCATRLELYQQRRYLMQMLNVKNGELTLFYTNDYKTYRISAYLDADFDFKERINNNAIADITFMCSNPYWLDKEDTDRKLKYLEEGIKFPLTFSARFAEAGYSKIVNNEGDVETPCILEYIGQATNPLITNETTGEFIKVNKTLAEGQKLVINTAEGEETVDIVSSNGTKENVFNWIDATSTFFKLKVGENKITYSSDSDTSKTVIVNVIYSNKYVGV